ncbi:hypothetical protein ABBQ32_003632 [Trebouxia sp. C0010 RCD-2024]
MDRPLPIRRRQRKPSEKRKTDVQAEAHHPPPARKQRSKRAGQASNKTGSKPRVVAKASKAAKLHGMLPAELEPLLEEEIIEDLAKIRSQAQAEDKESQIGSYSLKRKGRSGDDKARQAKEGQVKLNGLCINCPLTGPLLDKAVLDIDDKVKAAMSRALQGVSLSFDTWD